jgi:hypothetical protein
VDGTREPVRRPTDGEFVGYIQRTDDGRWQASTVFGAALETFDHRDEAVRFLVESGLAVLTERWWWWSAPEARWRRAFLVEAGPGWVLVRCGRDPKSHETRMLRHDEVESLRRSPQRPA